jgi:anti-sigma-K factor RskA
MAKQKRENAYQRQQNKKNGNISKTQLYSCYLSSAAIAVLCIMEALKPETQASGNPAMYYALAVLGVLSSVAITRRNKAAEKNSQPAGKRLK